MTPPGLCLLFNNAYSSLSPHADGPACSKHTHTHTTNWAKHSHNYTHRAHNQCERLFCSTSYLPPTVYARVCVAATRHAETPPVCERSWKVFLLVAVIWGLWRFAYNCTKRAYHRELCGTCKHLLCDLKARCAAIRLAGEMKGGQKWRERREWGENKGPLAFHCCANESHFVFSVSARLLFPLADCVCAFVCVCVCIALSLSRLPLFLHRHFSS